jgi:transposase
MGRRPVSQDLRNRIPFLRFEEHFSVKDICCLLGIRKTVVYDTLTNFRQHGVAYNPNTFKYRATGRRRKLGPMDVKLIKALLAKEACMYIDEIQDELLSRRGVVVSETTLLRTLRRIHFTRKSVSIRALERNDLARSAYMNSIAELVTDPAQLIFIDEAARNKKNTVRKFGWSLLGRRCVQRRCFVRGQRFSILPALTLNGIIAHDVIPGSVTSTKFVEFLREHVVCSVHSSSPAAHII